MFGYSTPVLAFSVVTCTVWVSILVWAVKQREHRGYHVWVLLLASVSWWVGERVAIRLGKYEYARFPLLFPFSGTPDDPDWLAKGLTWLVERVGLPKIVGCFPPQQNWDIPIPVVALEATLVFAFLRLSAFRLRNKGLPGAFATAGLSAVLMVTLAAILDPVVSTNQWCGAGSDPGSHGLQEVKLWHFFTNETYPGYWFGVPMVNYVAWFVAMATFNFLARLDDDGPRGLVRKYDHWLKYVAAAAAMLAILFTIEVPLKIGIDLVLVRGKDYVFDPLLDKRVWEFGVMALLLALGFCVIWWFGKVHTNPRIEGIPLLPPLLVFAFCLVALLREPHLDLFVVWLLTAAIAITVMFGLLIVRFIDRKRHPTSQGDARLHV